MATQTLYTSLGRSAGLAADSDRGRTDYTAATESVDRDRAPSSLYSQLSVGGLGGNDVGRTEVTKAGGETIDRDRHSRNDFSALVGAGGDLYFALANRPQPSGEDRGRTSVTESTESIDWDRPPIGPWT